MQIIFIAAKLLLDFDCLTFLDSWGSYQVLYLSENQCVCQ